MAKFSDQFLICQIQGQSSNRTELPDAPVQLCGSRLGKDQETDGTRLAEYKTEWKK